MAASDGIMHLVPRIKIRKDKEINIESMNTELMRRPYNKTCFFKDSYKLWFKFQAFKQILNK